MMEEQGSRTVPPKLRDSLLKAVSSPFLFFASKRKKILISFPIAGHIGKKSHQHE